jgi:extradiol dioxygenase family protein
VLNVFSIWRYALSQLELGCLLSFSSQHLVAAAAAMRVSLETAAIRGTAALRTCALRVAPPAAKPSLVRFASSAPSAALQPFHIAVPVHDLAAARAFYGTVLGCDEGRSSKTWIDWNFGGHQLVTHFASASYRGLDHFNDVDEDMVPVPHFGICLGVTQFHEVAARLKAARVTFLVEPHVRFAGKPGEQWTMFCKDPSGNNLEFKAMARPENLFAKYYVE